MVEHVVKVGNLALLVANDWKLEVGAGDLIDVLDPSSVAVDSVCGQTDQLNATSSELWLKLGESSKLSCADWGVILWVGEKDNPLVANELVEVDWTVGRLSLEIWGS